MKTTFLIALTLSVAASLQAGPLKQAEFTRVVNDVKTLPDQQQPKAARIGDVIAGRTAVTTGAQSRAELKFQDNTLTRLGSNSVFNMEQGTRNVDLKQGVMLMQVPKQMGGAKVRTAAVTAAVTGTTIMIEYQPDGYVKMIVLEGEMDVFLNDQPSVFRSIKAGDMIIMKPNSNYIPEPVQVDLERLKKTSKLTNDEEFGDLGNQDELNQADQQQAEQKKDGELIETALIIPGLGTDVVVDIERVRDLVPGVIRVAPGGTTTPPPTPDVTPPGTSPGKFGKPGTLGGLAVIDGNTEIVTDPTITTRFSGTVATGQGKIYRPSVDGGLGSYAFNETTNRTDASDLGTVPNVDREFRKLGTWGTFKFDDLIIVDQPGVNTVGGPTNLLLVSASDITLSDFDQTAPYSEPAGFWGMNQGSLNGLALVAYNNIYWEPGFTLTGSDQTVLLYTQNSNSPLIGTESIVLDEGFSSGDIIINGGFSSAVSLPDGVFSASAARDLVVNAGGNVGSAAPPPGETIEPLVQSSAVIEAADVKLSAARNVNIGSGTTIKASKTMHIQAGASLTISDSAQLRRLSQADPLDIVLAAETGNVNINGVSGGTVVINGSTVGIESVGGNVNINYANISADFLRARALSPSGQLLIGNSTLTAAGGIRLYAEGAGGGVRFTGNSTLAGPAILAGKTVQVDSGVSVNITQPNSLHIHADNHNYNGGSHGNFTGSGNPLNFLNDADVGTGPRRHNFSSRPTY